MEDKDMQKEVLAEQKNFYEEAKIPLSSDILQGIMDCIADMSINIELLESVIQKSNFISLNAAIEAARSRNQRDNFTLVAEQVNRQAEKMEEFSSLLKSNIKNLRKAAISSIGANLVFCSYCSGVLIGHALESLVEEVKAALRIFMRARVAETDEKADIVRNNLKNAEIFRNFFRHSNKLVVDVFVCDSYGHNICETANKLLNEAIIKRIENCYMDRNETKAACSNIYENREKNGYLIDVFIPVKIESDTGDSSVFYGYVTLNWNLMTKIAYNFPFDRDFNREILSQDGSVMASRGMKALLKENLGWLSIGSLILNSETGYSVEKARNGVTRIWGGSHQILDSHHWSSLTSVPLCLQTNEYVYCSSDIDLVMRNAEFITCNRKLTDITRNIEEYVKKKISINRQTNLLAVNASIQADIAGVEGEAFSVVAGEIGKLATYSEKVISSIRSISSEIDAKVRAMSLSNIMVQGHRAVQEIECSDHAFFRIIHYLAKKMTVKKNEIFVKSLACRLRKEFTQILDIIFLDKNGLSTENRDKAREYTFLSKTIKDEKKFCYSKGLTSSEFNCDVYYLVLPVEDEAKRITGYVVGISSVEIFERVLSETLNDPEEALVAAYLVNHEFETIVAKKFLQSEEVGFNIDSFCLHFLAKKSGKKPEKKISLYRCHDMQVVMFSNLSVWHESDCGWRLILVRRNPDEYK